MPIIKDGENVSVDYKIPTEIENRIPACFYPAFAKELSNIFKSHIFQKDENGCYGLYYVEGTTGWAEALQTTCQKLNMLWLWNYYSMLEWYDSDIFDSIIDERIISKYIEAESFGISPYYQFLLQNKEGETK